MILRRESKIALGVHPSTPAGAKAPASKGKGQSVPVSEDDCLRLLVYSPVDGLSFGVKQKRATVRQNS